MIGRCRDVVSVVYNMLYSMGQGKRNEEVEQTDTQEEEKLAGTSADDAIRKSSQATFILSSDRKTKVDKVLRASTQQLNKYILIKSVKM
jgi:hypothetical protein